MTYTTHTTHKSMHRLPRDIVDHHKQENTNTHTHTHTHIIRSQVSCTPFIPGISNMHELSFSLCWST